MEVDTDKLNSLAIGLQKLVHRVKETVLSECLSVMSIITEILLTRN